MEITEKELWVAASMSCFVGMWLTLVSAASILKITPIEEWNFYVFIAYSLVMSFVAPFAASLLVLGQKRVVEWVRRHVDSILVGSFGTVSYSDSDDFKSKVRTIIDEEREQLDKLADSE